MIYISSPITELKGIASKRSELLQPLGIFCVGDLLKFFPKSYIDFSTITAVADAMHGDKSAMELTISGNPSFIHLRGGMKMTSVKAFDATGSLRLVWFNGAQPKLCDGQLVYAYGTMDKSKGVKLINPVLFPSPPPILPVYKQIKGVPQNIIRTAMESALSSCGELIESLLPDELTEKYDILPTRDAIRLIHFPENTADASRAKRTLAFTDMLCFSIFIAKLRHDKSTLSGIAFRTENKLDEFCALLPFKLTNAQLRVINAIASDMEKPHPMNRLVQGDVGCGKTAIAMYAMYVAVQNGFQAILMAPTEILATQHFSTLSSMFPGEAVLLTGSLKTAERTSALSRIASGDAKYIVGTHALLQQSVEYKNLGLTITDEQHRFGVKQRAAITRKNKSTSPDVLVMSATPIPRTLALILYGDLDISIVDELPPHARNVSTRLIPAKKRADMYKYIEDEIKNGAQAYVVCPVIDKSDEIPARSAAEVFAELQKSCKANVGLLHGRMSANEKSSVMERFVNKDLGILVSTTVIEVGVDVKDASIMVIEGAERFGLAQLHQLRGRIGRGGQHSWCFLLSTDDAFNERLSLLEHVDDGFKLAEEDLKLRGPGQFWGSHQHGDFQLSSMATDVDTLLHAKCAAKELMSNECYYETAQKLLTLAQSRMGSAEDNAYEGGFILN